MIFPPYRWQVLQKYQTELENWVEQANVEQIKEFLITSHGLIYPDDWNDFLNLHLTYDRYQNDYIQGCQACQEILSALLTISETSRPELQSLFKR